MFLVFAREKMDLQDYLNRANPTHLRDLLSIFLVHQGARPACFIPEHAWTEGGCQQFIDMLNASSIRSLLVYSESTGFVVSLRPIPEYEFNKGRVGTERFGQILGYSCPGNNFNQDPRWNIEYREITTNISIYNELCNMDSFSREYIDHATALAQINVRRWNELMIRAKLSYRFECKAGKALTWEERLVGK